MKEKILEALTTKFEPMGVEADILDRIAQKAAKTITSEDQVATFVEGVTIMTILNAEGDRRATDAQKTAVMNYEKKHNIKDGKAVEKPKADDPKPQAAPEDMPAWAKAIIDSNKAMADRLNALDGERTANSRRAQLEEVLKSAPEKIRTRYLKDFDRLAKTFSDDDDYGTWYEEIKTDIEGITNDYTARSGVVTPPKVGGSKPNGGVSANVQARIDSQMKETPTSAIQG